MLLAKYADKSFDDLVNRKCAEHLQMKLHKRLGVSQFPVAKETIYPQTSRPSASGILGLRSPAPAVINIKERPNYSGGMPIGNLNDLQGKTISQVGINRVIPLNFGTPRATFIIPTTSTETSTEDLIFPVSRGTNTAIQAEENQLALLRKNTGTNPQSELEDLEYFSEAELKRLRGKSMQTQTEENPETENEANMFYQEALKEYRDITEDMSVNGTNPENSRRLTDLIERNERLVKDRKFDIDMAYRSGQAFGEAFAEEELKGLLKNMRDLKIFGEREKEMRYEALLKGLPVSTTIKQMYFTIQDELKVFNIKIIKQSPFNKMNPAEKIDYLLEELSFIYDDPTYELLYSIAGDPKIIKSNDRAEYETEREQKERGQMGEPSGYESEEINEMLQQIDDENVIDEVVEDLIQDQIRNLQV